MVWFGVNLLACKGALLMLLLVASVLWTGECSGIPAGQDKDNSMPCLPDKQEFWGVDTKHPYKSYFALDFVQLRSGIKRQGVGKMVKSWINPQAVRYDIGPASCTVSKISSVRDVPKCVPASAVKEGDSWSFKNIDGATLYYADTNPSRVVKKISPDGKNSDTYSGWNNTISDPHVFLIPARCDDVTHVY